MVIKSRKSMTYKQYNIQKKKIQKMHKTLHRTLEIEQHESHKNPELEGQAKTNKTKNTITFTK